MARIRNIKPSFWKNEDLAELPAFARLGFIGLWNCADCEGRLEDRPKRIKTEIFPYDDLSMDEILSTLHDKGFILRYKTSEGIPLIQVINFKKHQRLIGKEANMASDLEPPSNWEATGKQLGSNWEATGISAKNELFEKSETGEKTQIKKYKLFSQPPEIQKVAHWEATGKQLGSNWEHRRKEKGYIPFSLENKGIGNKDKGQIREKNNRITAEKNFKKNNKLDAAKKNAEGAWDKNSCQFSDEFKIRWLELSQQEKWVKKDPTSFDLALKKLMRFEEEFAMMQIEAAIMGNWQGVVFADTDMKYENWKNKNLNQNQNGRTNWNRNTPTGHVIKPGAKDYGKL